MYTSYFCALYSGINILNQGGISILLFGINCLHFNIAMHMVIIIVLVLSIVHKYYTKIATHRYHYPKSRNYYTESRRMCPES